MTEGEADVPSGRTGEAGSSVASKASLPRAGPQTREQSCTHQWEEGQQGPDSWPSFQCGCSRLAHGVEPIVSIIDPIWRRVGTDRELEMEGTPSQVQPTLQVPVRKLGLRWPPLASAKPLYYNKVLGIFRVLMGPLR